MKLFGIQIPFTGRKSTAPIPDDRYFAELLASEGASGHVTPQTAVNYTPVFAAIRVIAGNLAGLPLVTFEKRSDGGRDRAPKHPLYKLLKNKPNNRKTTAFEFREMLTAHMLLYGNAYAQIIRNPFGDPLELYPMHPTQVVPRLVEGQLVYKIRQDNGGSVDLPEYEVLHLRAFRDCGLEGLSPIAAARKAVEAGLSLEDFAKNFFQGGAFPTGVLEYEGGEMPPEARDNLRESWQKLHGGENRGKKVAVLEAGVKWKPMGIPQSDAQFLEQRRFGVEEISRIYGVPPHLLGDLSRSTNNNIEMQSQEFLTYCLRPWMERWEQVIVRDLLDGDDDRYFVKHVANALLRGDSIARGQFYAQGRQWGWFSINDIRELEDMNPIGEDGDIYLSPMNMVPAGDEGKVLEKPVQSQTTQPKDMQDEQESEDDGQQEDAAAEFAVDPEKLKAAFRGALVETWQRVVRKEINAVRAAARRKGEAFDPWFADFSREHELFARDCIKELARGYFLLREGRYSHAGDHLAREYRKSVHARVEAWKAEPVKGYDHREDELAAYWADRLLGYSGGEYERTTAA